MTNLQMFFQTVENQIKVINQFDDIAIDISNDTITDCTEITFKVTPCRSNVLTKSVIRHLIPICVNFGFNFFVSCEPEISKPQFVMHMVSNELHE